MRNVRLNFKKKAHPNPASATLPGLSMFLIKAPGVHNSSFTRIHQSRIQIDEYLEIELASDYLLTVEGCLGGRKKMVSTPVDLDPLRTFHLSDTSGTATALRIFQGKFSVESILSWTNSVESIKRGERSHVDLTDLSIESSAGFEPRKRFFSMLSRLSRTLGFDPDPFGPNLLAFEDALSEAPHSVASQMRHKIPSILVNSVAALATSQRSVLGGAVDGTFPAISTVALDSHTLQLRSSTEAIRKIRQSLLGDSSVMQQAFALTPIAPTPHSLVHPRPPKAPRTTKQSSAVGGSSKQQSKTGKAEDGELGSGRFSLESGVVRFSGVDYDATKIESFAASQGITYPLCWSYILSDPSISEDTRQLSCGKKWRGLRQPLSPQWFSAKMREQYFC